jgi:hypothetical protein
MQRCFEIGLRDARYVCDRVSACVSASVGHVSADRREARAAHPAHGEVTRAVFADGWTQSLRRGSEFAGRRYAK